MLTRSILAWVGIALFLSAPCYGAIFAFTVNGYVTGSSMAGVTTGDPVEIYYTAESADRNPDPQIGSYAASGPRVKFPDLVLTPGSDPETQVFVQTGQSNALGYSSRLGPPGEFRFGFHLFLPGGSLPSDALPTTLPISVATSNGFQITPLIEPLIVGRITSYQGIAIPEPAMGAVWVCVGLVLMRHKTRYRHRYREGRHESPTPQAS